MICPHIGILLACCGVWRRRCVATRNSRCDLRIGLDREELQPHPKSHEKNEHAHPTVDLRCGHSPLPVPTSERVCPGRERRKKACTCRARTDWLFQGISVGQQMSQTGFKPGDFDIEALLAGFNDGLQQKDPALTDDQLKETQDKIQALLRDRRQEIKAAQQAKGTKFLADNEKKDGVKTLEGGVQYKVLERRRG